VIDDSLGLGIQTVFTFLQFDQASSLQAITIKFLHKFLVISHPEHFRGIIQAAVDILYLAKETA
jgi:hypothetical protein